ncbi:MAG TPA: alpha/beta fold hydrolase [Methylibium sp.]|nr:alpha/beta fold hydrolase [Methylibium sp.]
MNAHTQRLELAGPAGALACAQDDPAAAPTALMVVCHPHPLHGGTMDNKVVQTIARTGLQLGWRVLRFNFRGVGGSAGGWDEGRGEVDDALAVVAAGRAAAPGLPLVLAGFSFGGYVAAAAAALLTEPPRRLALVAPSTQKQTVPPIAEALRADTVVIHGEDDEVVPLAATLDWARLQGLPVTVVPGVGHFFHGRLALLKTLLLRGLRAVD